MSEHRMQHPEGPTWCKNCGRFDFACDWSECPAPGSGAFDNSTQQGFGRIERIIFPQGIDVVEQGGVLTPEDLGLIGRAWEKLKRTIEEAGR